MLMIIEPRVIRHSRPSFTVTIIFAITDIIMSLYIVARETWIILFEHRSNVRRLQLKGVARVMMPFSRINPSPNSVHGQINKRMPLPTYINVRSSSRTSKIMLIPGNNCYGRRVTMLHSPISFLFLRQYLKKTYNMFDFSLYSLRFGNTGSTT